MNSNTKIWLMLTLVAMLVAVSLYGCSKDDNIGENGAISECGGFKSDAPVPMNDDYYDETPFCKDEYLVWQYDESSKTVTFTDTNVLLNCCGRHYIELLKDGSVYEIKETDKPEKFGARCSCSCMFDFRIELSNVEEDTMELRITLDVTDDDEPRKTVWSGAIDLSAGQGQELIKDRCVEGSN